MYFFSPLNKNNNDKFRDKEKEETPTSIHDKNQNPKHELTLLPRRQIVRVKILKKRNL